MSEAEALADIQKDAMLDQFCAVTGKFCYHNIRKRLSIIV